MKTLWTSLLGAGLALALSSAVYAQAAFDHFESIDLSPASITNVVQSGNSSLTFTPHPATDRFATPTGTDIVVANLELNSTPTPNGKDTFNVPYKITVTLTDKNSGAQSGPPNTVPLVFQGAITGDVFWDPTGNAVGSTLTNTWYDPQVYSIVLGGTSYNLTTSLFAKPEVRTPNNPTAGLGTLNVRVAAAIPEPGSMALLGTGLLPLLGFLRRRR